MLLPRVIPALLLRSEGLVKTTRFAKPVYLGDPINVIRIFNDKEVDELVLLDIDASAQRRDPNFRLLSEISSECFMPLAYGGGVRTIEHVKRLLALGIEKIVVNTAAAESPDFVRAAADQVGSQSVVVSLDVKRRLLGGCTVRAGGGKVDTRTDPVTYARRMQDAGAGELLLTSIDRDGTMSGYDLDVIRQVTSVVEIPVVACGGAATIHDFGQAVHAGGASAVAAGAMFVFQGAHRGVLISFPARAELARIFAETSVA